MVTVVYSVELRQLLLFAALTPAELAGVAAAARSADYRHGMQLFQAGYPCDGVTFVLTGFVRLARLAADGAEVTTGIVGPGGPAAVGALRGHMEHDDTADALGRVRTVEISAALLLDLMSRTPHLFAELSRCLVARIGAAYVGAQADAQTPLVHRIVHTLRCLARPYRLPGTDAMHPLAVRLSHAELARLVGADRTTVTRAIGSLAAQGSVQRERGHVTGVAIVAPLPSKRTRVALGQGPAVG